MEDTGDFAGQEQLPVAGNSCAIGIEGEPEALGGGLVAASHYLHDGGGLVYFVEHGDAPAILAL